MVSYLQLIFLTVVYFVCKYYYAKYKVEHGRKALSGKTVIVTGAGSGIGLQMALYYLELGCNVVIAGRTIAKLEESIKVFREKGFAENRFSMVQCDAAVQKDCKNLIAQTVTKFGQLDVVTLNHAWGRVQLFADVTEDKLDSCFYDTYESNVKGNMYLIHYALPELRKTRGKILYVSSMSAYYGVPKLSFYSSTKYAMHSFLNCVRVEEAGKKSGVQITIAAPGLIGTDTAKAYVNPKEFEGAMAPSRCARLMVDGLLEGQREMKMNLVDRPPINGTAMYYVGVFFPSFVDWFMLFNSSLQKEGGLKDAILEHPLRGKTQQEPVEEKKDL
eukprot:TRINITY_DN13694_c0_g1_i1.p1 TRINITY_DN13694_c0_g1~~TRINITY_DN13694_c0_g1_i1.p1  ORF type:complete len:330 (+),score=102.57 TRINITY_DN13694_c0_g1_i1:59-1048(+)